MPPAFCRRSRMQAGEKAWQNPQASDALSEGGTGGGGEKAGPIGNPHCFFTHPPVQRQTGQTDRTRRWTQE
jgi:hypothetical protein